MARIIEIRTDRLLLRQWKDEDLEAFYGINSNLKVMKFFPRPLDRTESDELTKRFQTNIAENGWGFWAVEVTGVCDFIGFVGLNTPDYPLPCSPCVEIGWRLAEKYWGKGYATEAAQSALRVGFTQLGLTEIVSFTSVLNHRSINVMERLKMNATSEYFDHPKVPQGSPLQKHCLYKLSRVDWEFDNN
jgi:RimJ/RimL family protein N-acetyltransferase